MSKSKKPAANQIYQPPRAEVVRGEKTVDYFSPALTWLMAGAAARPFFTLIQAQAMLLDHQVWYGLQLRNAPLMQAKVKVTGPSSEINKFVQDQWDRFWQRCAPKVVATKYFGYAGFEPLYCEKNGLVEIDDLKDFSPADVRPLRQAGNGAFAGRIAGVSVRGQRRSMQGEPSYSPTRLFGKKGLWLSYDAVAGNPFGSSATYKAYGPWWDKAMPGGAYDLRRLRGCKDAWIGDIVRYPLNYTLMTPDGNKITGKDIARELAETRQSGGAMWIPSDKGADGTPLFEYEPPQTVADSTIIKSWIDDSDNEIFDGLLVPKEVVEAASSGSGFSGRSIPFVMFLAVCDIEFLGYVRAWKQQIGEALVIENFGVAANDFDMEPIPLVDIMADKMEGQAMGGPVGGSSGGPPQPGQPGRPGDDGGAGPRGPGAGPREPAPGNPGLNLQFGSLFDEDEHPRAGDGKFANKAGGGRSSARGGDSEPLFKTIKAGGDDTTKTRQKMLLSGLKSLAGQKDLFATDGERETEDEAPAPKPPKKFKGREEVVRQKKEAYDAIASHIEAGKMPILHKADTSSGLTQHILIAKSAQEPGKWQLTQFDKDMSPCGHATLNSLDDAIKTVTGSHTSTESPPMFYPGEFTLESAPAAAATINKKENRTSDLGHHDAYTEAAMPGHFEKIKQAIEDSDKKISPSRAGELAAALLLKNYQKVSKEFGDEMDRKDRNGEEITDAESDTYDRFNDRKWSPSRQLEKLSGSRSLLADMDEVGHLQHHINEKAEAKAKPAAEKPKRKIPTNTLGALAKSEGKRFEESTGKYPFEVTGPDFAETMDPHNTKWQAGQKDSHKEWVEHGLVYAPDLIPDEVLREYAETVPAAQNEISSRREAKYAADAAKKKTEAKAKPAAAPGMLFSVATETDEQTGRARWVTLNGGDGGDGARVLIGKDGYIYAGPSSMQGQKVQDLATNKQTRRKMADRKANQTKDRRSENKSAREGQLAEAIETAATDYGLDPEHLAESVDWIHSEALKRAEERETAKAQIRETTGLSQREINNLENSGYDHSSAYKVGGITGGKFKDFDQFAQQAARNYPELGLGDPDDPAADFESALWQLLAEGKQDLPNKWDPEIIDEAVSLMRNAYPVDESDEFLEFSTSGDKPPGDRKKASAAAAGLRANESASAEIYRRLADLLKKN